MASTITGYMEPVLCLNPRLNRWAITWNEQVLENGLQTRIMEVIDHKPTLSECKEIILNWFNSLIDNDILTGFMWNGMSVWLSSENQFNYKAAYDLAVLTGGKLLPTFKFGTVEEPVYHKFTDVNELSDFYIKAMSYVTDTLAEGWAAKDNIDWSIYEELLK